jgi:hypothetical protein
MAANQETVLLIQDGDYSYPEFNYDAINHQDSSSKFAHYVEAICGNNGEFTSTAENGKFFVYLEMQKPPDDIDGNIFPNRKFGWKFHVSIDDTDPNNIEKGWNLVKEILIRERVYTSKVVAKGRQMAETQVLEKGSQRGKQITIYTTHHPDRRLDAWSKLVSEITRVLAENEIAPSHSPESDEPIEGSNYVSFRSDGYYNDKHNENVEFNRVEDWRDQLRIIYPGEFDQFKAAIQINPPVHNQKPNLTWNGPPSKCCPM